MYGDKSDTLDMFDGWVGVHKMKYYDIITVPVWVSICTVVK